MNQSRTICERPLFFPIADQHPVEWLISDGLTDYETALSAMENRAEQIANGTANECVWLLEHPPLYTCLLYTSDAADE